MYVIYRYPSMTLHGAITYKIAMWIFTITKTSNHTNSSSIHLCRHCGVTFVQNLQTGHALTLCLVYYRYYRMGFSNGIHVKSCESNI